MRQYWRDLDSLERWTRSEPHRRWWQDFLKDTGGTGFWHEAYFMRGGIDAIYADMAKPTGLARFAPAKPARGAMFSARHRAGRHEALTVAPVIAERAYYDPATPMGEGPNGLESSDGALAPDQPVQSEQQR
jgi:hypothetical protein